VTRRADRTENSGRNRVTRFMEELLLAEEARTARRNGARPGIECSNRCVETGLAPDHLAAAGEAAGATAVLRENVDEPNRARTRSQ